MTLPTQLKADICNEIKRLLCSSVPLDRAITKVARSKRKTKTSVRAIWYSSNSQLTFPARRKFMSDSEKTIATGLLYACALASLPLPPKEAREMLSEMLGRTLSSSSFDRWLKSSNHDLVVARAKPITKKRIDAAKYDEVDAYCDILEAEMARVPYIAESVFNLDETTVEYRSNNTYGIFMGGMPKKNKLTKNTDKRLTLLTFIRATGERFLSIFLVQSGDDDSEGFFEVELAEVRLPQRATKKSPILFYKSRTGKLNQDTFAAVMKRFSAMVKIRGIERSLYLFCDQCSSHTNLHTIREMFEKHISICFFPSDTSHFLQPLDDVPFAVFKSRFDKIFQDFASTAAIKNLNAFTSFTFAAIQAEKQSFTPPVIRRGFENTGIFPYNRAIILKNAENCRSAEDDQPEKLLQQATLSFGDVIERKLDPDNGQRRRRRKRIRDEQAYPARDNVRAAEASNNAFKPPKKRAKLVTDRDLLGERAWRLRDCPVDGCGVHHYRGLGWHECADCGQHFCPKHRQFFANHVQSHHVDIMN